MMARALKDHQASLKKFKSLGLKTTSIQSSSSEWCQDLQKSHLGSDSSSNLWVKFSFYISCQHSLAFITTYHKPHDLNDTFFFSQHYRGEKTSVTCWHEVRLSVGLLSFLEALRKYHSTVSSLFQLLSGTPIILPVAPSSIFKFSKVAFL